MTSKHIWHNNYSAFTLIFSKFRDDDDDLDGIKVIFFPFLCLPLKYEAVEIKTSIY